MNNRFARIIVDISHEKLDKAFSYKIPEDLMDKVTPGTQVMIPFGAGNKLIKGYVLECTDTVDFDISKVKEIAYVVEKQVQAEGNSIRLAAWMKEQYGSTLITALKTVLPVKKEIKGIVKKTVCSNLNKDEWVECIKNYKKSQTARLRLATELMNTPQISYELVVEKLAVSPTVIKAMENEGQLTIMEEGVFRNPIMGVSKEPLLEPSKEQQYIIDDITRDCRLNANGRYLIHGITGSGKTLVYIHLIKNIIEQQKQAIVLIPEIALTYQTVLRFHKAFGERVTFVNSKLSPGEKYDQFERAKRGEVDVVIGPRSALFVPFNNLGMIIIDEEHESSYKSESMPKYHAREVAFELASYYNAAVVLGSATPSVEASYMCEKGLVKKYTLTRRLTGGNLPTVQIADLREELKNGNRTIFSNVLRDMIEDRLERNEQIILFLNRRGYAGFVSCRTCGTVMKCPHCDVSLSEHRNGTLVCHYCGYTIHKPSLCPVCKSKYLLGFKAGTQQIEEALWREFPHAKTLRMDADTTKQKESYEEILSSFANREADILIGTQMIVKGHDFPFVTLVGILAADISLHASDFRAGERTFELLTQAAGRAGRGNMPGDVIIQTYQPDNPYIVYASKQDYNAFYEEEIQYRELMEYPPAAHLLSIQVFSKAEDKGQKLIQCVTDYIREKSAESTVKIIGPAPAGIGKIKDVYRFVTYVKDIEKERLIKVKNQVEDYMQNLSLKQEYIQFDFDPMNM